MNSKLIATMALALMIAGPAIADTCNVPPDKAQSKDTLKAQLEKDGWTVRQIKDDQGCYEVYASKADGTRMEKLEMRRSGLFRPTIIPLFQGRRT